MNHTLVLIKPDAVRRSLIGEIITRIEEEFKIEAMLLTDEMDLIEAHYEEHAGQSYYNYLIAAMQGPLVALIVQHKTLPDCTISEMRSIIGPYKDRQPGTIRFDFAVNDTENSIHASDSPESAKRELNLWFPNESAYL